MTFNEEQKSALKKFNDEFTGIRIEQICELANDRRALAQIVKCTIPEYACMREEDIENCILGKPKLFAAADCGREYTNLIPDEGYHILFEIPDLRDPMRKKMTIHIQVDSNEGAFDQLAVRASLYAFHLFGAGLVQYCVEHEEEDLDSSSRFWRLHSVWLMSRNTQAAEPGVFQYACGYDILDSGNTEIMVVPITDEYSELLQESEEWEYITLSFINMTAPVPSQA